jgi:hypothetical protein
LGTAPRNKSRELLVLLLFSFASGQSLVFAMRAVGFSSPLFAFMVTFTALGLTGLARPFSFMKLPASFQQVRSWELKGDAYRALGVPTFGTLLRRTPLRYFNSQVYLKYRRNDPDQVCAAMEAAEAAHVWAMVLTTPYVVLMAIQIRWSTIFWFILINVGGNVYPVLHLRWARGRLMRVRDKKLLPRARIRGVLTNS